MFHVKLAMFVKQIGGKFHVKHSLAEFAAGAANKAGYDFRRRVRRKSYFSACKRASAASALQQAANLLV